MYFSQTIWLSTAPSEPLTHWYQVRCLIDYPLLGQLGSKCSGRLVLSANARQSYDVELEMTCNGQTGRNLLDLKNPCFRYTGQPIQPPPGHLTTSPSDSSYWNAPHSHSVGDDALSLSNSNVSPYNMVNGTLGDNIPDLSTLQSMQNGSNGLSPAGNVFGLATATHGIDAIENHTGSDVAWVTTDRAGCWGTEADCEKSAIRICSLSSASRGRSSTTTAYDDRRNDGEDTSQQGVATRSERRRQTVRCHYGTSENLQPERHR
ncbi:unnamed protein product [Soboliphyme baturini]|uniref:Uncharacterized protein n=1 Tax=Soboliphyme baturini TaxID=241478 RepID=A0A3P8B7F4_9BILA|nr:unnamed protein product [Soboliphyme baturini]